MTSNKRHDKSELKIYRKELRKNLTPAEAYLWKQIQNKNLAGRKFRRQHSIDHYIIDFYCAEESSHHRTGWAGSYEFNFARK